ncbi:NAD(+) diphosphatase [Pseudoclavibacter chungangensis]|uniref:NAD(+) diphosphatase n=1 Tax=Pseudoclavibacter chungangensis TaxID=587635 RepID=A0A7J5BPQ3_9MICO|nr:NAD(+) diphosphatase [Pseudoclavibacter chungangensis]KAB1655104.1 NAD(+) diphosphatase [Pseudoclavibacter chungangensis]NYJ66125.1 NAD+ diphosphatase [Pseudoclavibacter chungangensis]
MSDFMSRLPLARHHTDRDSEHRADPGLLDSLRGDPGTRVLLLRAGDALLRRGADGNPELDLRTVDSLADIEAVVDAFEDRDGGRLVYLGRTTRERSGGTGEPSGTRVVSIDLDEGAAHRVEPDPGRWASLREVANVLDEVDCGLYTEALAMANWHRVNGFSPRSGHRSRAQLAGWVRGGTEEGDLVFPRTDAAVIAAVVDADDRILLGANAQWTPKRFSLLAGFVEPGESFESAVAREVWEESRARIVEPRYLGSQPWPFPASIMVGFTCRLHPDQDPESVRPDDDEIIDLRWFTREEIVDYLGTLPGTVSIARAILEDWYGGPIPG